jgi:hypothetical protein
MPESNQEALNLRRRHEWALVPRGLCLSARGMQYVKQVEWLAQTAEHPQKHCRITVRNAGENPFSDAENARMPVWLPSSIYQVAESVHEWSNNEAGRRRPGWFG